MASGSPLGLLRRSADYVTVGGLARQWFPHTDVALGEIGPVAELTCRARRAEDDDLRRLPIVKVERDLADPAAACFGAAPFLHDQPLEVPERRRLVTPILLVAVQAD